RDLEVKPDPQAPRLVRLDDATPRVYGDEKALVAMMAARAGDERLKQALFRGDTGPLRESLDGDLGQGSFDRLQALMLEAERYEEGDARRQRVYTQARELLKGH
ncbi:MAG: hypothetical protein ACREA0_28135, partial [bacterium]